MKRIVLFDPAQGSLNAGDFIINECLEEEMKFLFDNECLVHYSTHLPISRFYQTFRKNLIYKTCKSADYKFLCGTNLFKNSLIRISPDWNINFTSCEYYKNSIAIGCGMDMNSPKSNLYTKYIYKKILSPDYIHSVRDERTKRYLESLGLQAINTGCPTLWKFTPENCKLIKRKKRDNVIFTLTDYKRDIKYDKILIEILRKNYKKISFWVQGFDDYDYLKSITDIHDIEIIPHSIHNFSKKLKTNNIEYVGTRLHAGIYAMRHGVRSIIIAIDNRVIDMQETYNLPIVNRKNIGHELSAKINASFSTDIKVPTKRIEYWKGQFV